MRHEYTIDLNRIMLRPLMWDDIENLRVLRNRERNFFLDSTEISEEQQRKWYNNYLLKDNDIMFSIVRKSDQPEFCGSIALYSIDKANGLCEIGRTLIDKEICPDKGIGLEATCGVCKFAFETLGMQVIQTKILKSNARSLKLHERAGFYTIDFSDERFCVVEIKKENMQSI